MNLIPPLIDSVQACQAHRLTDSIDGGFVKSLWSKCSFRNFKIGFLFYLAFTSVNRGGCRVFLPTVSRQSVVPFGNISPVNNPIRAAGAAPHLLSRWVRPQTGHDQSGCKKRRGAGCRGSVWFPAWMLPPSRNGKTTFLLLR